MREILEALTHPFPKGAIKWRAGATNKDKTKAMALPYVDPREYEARLDKVCPDWQCTFTTWGDNRVICHVSINGITRSSTGEGDGDDFAPGTTAEAQAFKRACSKFGLGRYLYSLPTYWVAFDGKKLLEYPQLTVDQEPVRLSKDRAAAMHKELGKLGIRNDEHYQLASHVAGRPIESLQQLTAKEAADTWNYCVEYIKSDKQAKELLN